ncbi:ZIP family metal transporter [Candidatus Peregrinibacteria bacterium CG10_big_fil_rev_8_21_14_0_10_42_8]|nr:MAG: ZIP family metal transporter [Candidatus Peregrinibacteria bacterium CG10_big_fil_rev_8_21_14_0_10_42_8]
MSNNLLAIGAVVGVSLISLVGVIPLVVSKRLRSWVLFLVSFSVGALLGDVFLHIVPEMAEAGGIERGAEYILLGMLISFIIEKLIHWRHCHTLPDDKHEHCHDHHHHIGIMNLFADGLHNFIDGTLIAASFLVDTQVGIATTIAVGLHEIPQEIGDFAVLLHSGFTKKKAILFNMLSACSAIVGAIAVLFLQSVIPVAESVLLPIAAGNFLYIAGVDLIPELHKETRISNSMIQLLSIIGGIGVMYALKFIEIA